MFLGQGVILCDIKEIVRASLGNLFMDDNTDHQDATDNKLRNKGQTEMKHRILSLYLKPWIRKVSKVNSRLLFVDGFAGSGIYPDGTRGSPMIAMDVADEVLSENDSVSNRVEEFECIFVEKDEGYYRELKKHTDEYEAEVDNRINKNCIHTEFQDWAPNFIRDHEHKNLQPALIFVDPFGYRDIPFKLLSEFFSLRDQNLELLINLMAGKMAPWVKDSDKEQTITDTLGTDVWKERVESLGKDERAEALCDIYERQWKSETDANFTMPFEMVEEGKRQTSYYLIHVTNHLHGLKVMKETMYNAGADDKYAYLGPDHIGFEDNQLSFTEFRESDDLEERIKSFALDLHKQYEQQTLSFDELLRQTLDKNVFKTKHYRHAFEILSVEEGILQVNGDEYTRGNNVTCSEDEAEISFLEKTIEKKELSDYI